MNNLRSRHENVSALKFFEIKSYNTDWNPIVYKIIYHDFLLEKKIWILLYNCSQIKCSHHEKMLTFAKFDYLILCVVYQKSNETQYSRTWQYTRVESVIKHSCADQVNRHPTTLRGTFLEAHTHTHTQSTTPPVMMALQTHL